MHGIVKTIIWLSAIIVLILLTQLFLLPSKEGDTKGLVEKLLALDMVIDITDYDVYEGSASFQLLLKNNKSIALYGIDNKDLVSTNTIVIAGINGSNIYCRSESGGGHSGISIWDIQEQLLPENDNLNNLQGVLAEFNQLEKLLSNLPIQINDSSYEDNRIFICRDESIKSLKLD